MNRPLLQTRGLTKAFGALMATCNLNLEVHAGQVHALIGPNGAGKTTLLKQLSGEMDPDRGSILFNGVDITGLPMHKRAGLGLARSYQITSIFLPFTAEDNVAVAVQASSGHSFRFWKPSRTDPLLRDPARECLALVGLDRRANVTAGNLSHGEQRQLELAMALATKPRMLLLDEPTAGMGLEDTERMIELLKGLKGSVTMLLVEHDMEAVFALADRLTVLDYGEVLCSGPPETVRNDAVVQKVYLGEEKPCSG